MMRDDPQFVSQYLPGARQVIHWFEQRLKPNHLLGAIEWWPFIDWVPGQWERGNPPGAIDGESVVLSLQFAYALQKMAELENAFGQASEAKRYLSLANNILAATHKLAWDSKRNLVKDTPDGKTYSQQTNVLAILTKLVDGNKKKQLMQRILEDRSLTQSSYYFQFYEFEALKESGLGNLYIERLNLWKEMLALGLTTTLEHPEPSRSDSHAWSAHPNYGLIATVLGIRSKAPGFKSIVIEPHLGSLKQAEGKMPHPKGIISVELSVQSDHSVAVVTLPDGLTGEIFWYGKKFTLSSGKQILTFDN